MPEEPHNGVEKSEEYAKENNIEAFLQSRDIDSDYQEIEKDLEERFQMDIY